MKTKNIMLLGFVNKAVDYLNRHMDEEPDTRLAELKNIDLASIKEELNDNLDASLGTMQSTMTTLLKAGNEAFDKFIESNHGKENISDQLNDMFNVDFDHENNVDNTKELGRLLSFYNLEDEFVDEESHEIGDEYVEPIEGDEFMKQIKKNATNDDTDGIMPIERNVSDDAAIDSIFTEIVENEGKDNTKVEEPVVEETRVEQPVEEQSEQMVQEEIKEEPAKEVEQTQSYVSSLIDDLKKQLEKEEAFKKEHEDKNKAIYERISSLYPHVPQGFLRSVYELKETLANDYKIGDDIIVLHRVLFKDVENLRKFVEIGLNHGYTINADENKLIVDIFKEFENSDGKILSNIYEVANQGYLLKGSYEGYNVLLNGKE